MIDSPRRHGVLGGVVRFVKGSRHSGRTVLAWVTVLALVNGIAPLAFLTRLEAQVVLATFIASFFLMIWLTMRYGFTRILGAGHVLWVPLVVFLLVRANELEMDVYGLWVGTVIVLNVISLMIDVRDVMRYAGGDREETVKGL